jgi:hypothetical protein
VGDQLLPRTDLRALLESVEAAAPTEAIDVVTHELAVMVGAREVSFLIADFSGHAVVRFGAAEPEGVAVAGRHGVRSRETLPLANTVYQRLLRTQQVDVSAIDDGAQLTLPVTDRGDAIGVLELILPHYPDAQVIADVAAAAHALAYVVVANRRHTDLFEWGQRTTPFSLAAEIQRRLLPGSSEDALQVSITDAAGHDVAASLLATLLVGSLRNGRRRGTDLGEQARNANDALVRHSSVGQFVTGQLMRIDLNTSSATIINAGHPFPLRLRDGRVEEIELAIDLPFGIRSGSPFSCRSFR